ncbi:MAG: hypothetical protein ACFCVE_15995 [Phycisphaerae bacterium]
MKAHLAVTPALRSTANPPEKSVTYVEFVTRWFGGKTGSGQWPPTVDDLPGVTLACRGGPDERTMNVRHDWRLGLAHRLDGDIRYGGAMRAPASWDIRHELDPYRGKPELAPLAEAGRWADGVLVRKTTTTRGKQESTVQAPALLCSYTLLGDFPAEPVLDRPAGVLVDGMTFIPNGKLQAITGPLAEHPAADGLTGYSLHHDAGLPIEFWVNTNGVVIYLCEGPNRVLVLSNLEALS